MDLAADDRRFLWHPFTQQQGWAEEDAPIIERAERCELIDKSIVDYAADGD